MVSDAFLPKLGLHLHIRNLAAFLWLSSSGNAHDELVCAQPVETASAPAQSATLWASEREKFLSAFQEVGADIFVMASSAETCVYPLVKSTGNPDTGNPHVRFDEGEGDALPTLLV